MTVLTIDQALTRAKSHRERGEVEDARHLLEAVLEAFPNHSEARKDLEGVKALLRCGDNLNPPQEVIDRVLSIYNSGQLLSAFEEAKVLTTDYPGAFVIWNIMGAAAAQLEMLDEAINAFEKVISLKPDCADGHFNLGNALKSGGRMDEAISAFSNAVNLNSELDVALNNMGTTLQDLGRIEQASDAFNMAIKISPDYDQAHNNLGNLLKIKGCLEDGIASYKKALSINPNYAGAHRNLGFALLNIGKTEEGLEEFEWRWEIPKNLEARRHFSKPAWDGKKSLKGKRILLWSEQGIGDTLLWSCFIPLVSSQADHCILECQEKLVPLLMRSHPDITVQPENREFDASRDDFDFHLPMGSLYRQLFSKISQQSTTNAFLIPDPARVNYWKERLQSLGDGPYVGIGWKSSKMLPNRMPNYAPLSDWAPLLTLPEVTFINLQYTDFVDDLNSVKSDLGVKVHNFEDLDLLNDIDDVAALCSALDMVVATTSAIPLISAGVGTLTKFACWKQSSWNNPLFQPRGSQLDIFYRNTWDPWEPVFGSIAEDIANS